MAKVKLTADAVPEGPADTSNKKPLSRAVPKEKRTDDYARIQVITDKDLGYKLGELMKYRQRSTEGRYTLSKTCVDILKAYFESSEGSAELSAAIAENDAIRARARMKAKQ